MLLPSSPKGTRQRYKFLRNFRYVLCTRYAFWLDMSLRDENKEFILYRICVANISSCPKATYRQPFSINKQKPSHFLRWFRFYFAFCSVRTSPLGVLFISEHFNEIISEICNSKTSSDNSVQVNRRGFELSTLCKR